MDLSILIPTLYGREHLFNRITQKLTKQIHKAKAGKRVEILTYKDKRGEHTTGHKRNVLLSKAKGKFAVFVDDDDTVSSDYIRKILGAIKENPKADAIGIQGMYTENGKNPVPFEVAIGHPYELKNGWYLRPPNHIVPVRREHAIAVGFPDKTFGEDYEYCMGLKESGLLKEGVVIKHNMYQYDFIPNKTI